MCNSFGFGGNDSSLILSKKSCVPSHNVFSFEVEQVSESIITNVEQLRECKDLISPMESRRMGKLMKAATLTSLRALKAADVEVPDAIITATAFGMTENSEKFLQDVLENGETLLKPTLFMQSTHNTIGSNIAIRLGCHGYNITYSQGNKSWKWA
jgi:3-oxoacyl-(acyl-carrier-protein) synthase